MSMQTLLWFTLTLSLCGKGESERIIAGSEGSARFYAANTNQNASRRSFLSGGKMQGLSSTTRQQHPLGSHVVLGAALGLSGRRCILHVSVWCILWLLQTRHAALQE